MLSATVSPAPPRPACQCPYCGLQQGRRRKGNLPSAISAWPSSPVWVQVYWRGTLSTHHVHTGLSMGLRLSAGGHGRVVAQQCAPSAQRLAPDPLAGPGSLAVPLPLQWHLAGCASLAGGHWHGLGTGTFGLLSDSASDSPAVRWCLSGLSVASTIQGRATDRGSCGVALGAPGSLAGAGPDFFLRVATWVE